MGGLKLFSVGNVPSRHTSALRAARMPLFSKMNYLDFYSMSIFKRISSQITDENFRKLRLLYSSRGISLDNRWKRNETPSEKISIFFRSLKNNNILNLAENIFSAVSTIIDEGYTSDIGTDIYDGYSEFNGMLDSLQEEAIGKELDYYPHDNTFGSYIDSRLHSVIKILGDHNNEWNGGFTISLVEDYFSLLKEFSNHFQEVNYSSIDEAIESYFAEEMNAAYLEFEQLEGSSLPNRFLSDKIRLSKHDEMLAQLPIDEVLFDQDSENFVPIKRILLVEYKDPKTLESITRNTAGELCVGRQGMRYMRSLADGSQRHFGILAQTDDGVSVMYHTHYMGENITPSQFTNFNNTEGISEKNSEHENILRQAKRILDQRVKKQQ